VAQQRCQQGPVRRAVLLPAQLAFQDRDLMPQGKDVRVLVSIARGKKGRAPNVIVTVK
jgi:hypothetical protein